MDPTEKIAITPASVRLVAYRFGRTNLGTAAKHLHVHFLDDFREFAATI
jgi:hypothetical protein